MNAAMRKYVVTEAEDMSADEKSYLEIQVAELRADVRHVQSDTTEIKAELRATTTEIKTELRATNQRIDELKDSLASAKIWAFGLYVALSGSMFYVMARGFRWL
jgi:predicted RNase H-like nuclease (RuvC/YqgF family)